MLILYLLVLLHFLNISAFSTLNVINCKSRMRITMAKNDGKSKKKKKSESEISTSSSSSTSSSPSTTSPVSRVTNQINIPVRQQIAWAKAYKRLMTQTSSSASAGQSKKFRRKSDGPKEEEEYVEINYVDTKPPAVFVDGYNVIGYMKQVDNSKINISFEEARDSLISDLSVLRGATGWWLEVVFDAYLAQSIENQYVIDNVLVTYTGKSETADNYIERRFVELKNEGYTNMVVVTGKYILHVHLLSHIHSNTIIFLKFIYIYYNMLLLFEEA